jgi:hypothetical protein
MNLAEIFIRRPIATTLVMIGIVIFGLMSYRLLPISDLLKSIFRALWSMLTCLELVPKRWLHRWQL